MHPGKRVNSGTITYDVGQGYPPDIIVEEEIADIVNAKDRVMEMALEKIR